MLKPLKLWASACCVVVLLSACGGKEDKTTNSQSSASTTTAAPAPSTSTAPVATAPAGNDPFAYCQAKGTIDKPDASYTGEPVPETLVKALVNAQLVTADMPASQLKQAGFVSWRCMDKKVMACVVGANIPCADKADTNKEPNAGIVNYCKTNTIADSIPASAAGRTTVYMWSCKDGKPQMGEQMTQVDAQSYPSNYWSELKAN